MKAQVIPKTTLQDMMDKIRESGAHEKRIVGLLRNHGKRGKRLVFFRADNFQLCYNATAHASAKDATRDSAHIVFTSAIKSGDAMPADDTVMLRATLDPDLETETTICSKKYYISIEDPLFSDNEIGAQPHLVRVTHPAFAPNGKYYDKRHLQPVTDDERGSGSHTITVPVTRKCGCNFDIPDSEYSGALGKQLKKLLQGRMHYQTFLKHKCPHPQEPPPSVSYSSYKERVASAHGTSAGHCDLQNTTAVAADDLNPGDDTDMLFFMLGIVFMLVIMLILVLVLAGDDTDMLLFMLHLYSVILSTGDDALRLFWPITFDEDTYTRYEHSAHYTIHLS